MANTLWFECVSPPRKNSLQLFCFPYAGGSAQIFRPWQRRLPAGIDVILAHLPGRAKRMREPLATRLQPLVVDIADAIVPELQDQFIFFGHSMGAVIAFELVRELRRRSMAGPTRLFVAGRTAPQWPDSSPVIFSLPHDEFIAELRRLNGTPQELLENPELMELLLPVIRADFELIETYEYRSETPIECHITAYGGLQDEDVPIESVYAWKQQTSSSFSARMLPGDHFFVHSPGFPDVLLNDLADLVKEKSA